MTKPPVSTSLDEQRLIQRTQHGDTEAFVPLFSKYQKTLSHQIDRRVRNPDVAKDLTQETWLKALRGLRSFRCESAFSRWLYRIAENVITDHFRRQSFHRLSGSCSVLGW